MIAHIHVMQVFKTGWKVYATSRAEFRKMFLTERLDESIVDQWYDSLCPDGSEKVVSFVEQYVHGTTKLPAILVESIATPNRDNEIPMAANTRSDKPVRYAFTHNVNIAIYAKTPGQVDALSVAVVAMLGQGGEYLTKTVGYRNLNLGRLGPKTGLQALGQEKTGGHKREIPWSMVKDHLYPPISPENGQATYLSLHHFDATDAYGNQGRVTVEEG